MYHDAADPVQVEGLTNPSPDRIPDPGRTPGLALPRKKGVVTFSWPACKPCREEQARSPDASRYLTPFFDWTSDRPNPETTRDRPGAPGTGPRIDLAKGEDVGWVLRKPGGPIFRRPRRRRAPRRRPFRTQASGRSSGDEEASRPWTSAPSWSASRRSCGVWPLSNDEEGLGPDQDGLRLAVDG